MAVKVKNIKSRIARFIIDVLIFIIILKKVFNGKNVYSSLVEKRKCALLEMIKYKYLMMSESRSTAVLYLNQVYSK